MIPAAGLGTRLLPLTLSQPKEMVACGPLPVIGYVLDELRAAGITDLILVSRSGKATLEEYVFDQWPGACVVHQARQQGLGDAVAQARRWVGGEPFIVANGDTIIQSASGCSALDRMLAEWPGGDASMVMVREVPPELVNRYGVVSPAKSLGVNGALPLSDMVEKPEPSAAPSNLAIAGRYLFSSAVFDALDAVTQDSRGEIQLTDAMRILCRQQTMFASVMGRGEYRFDIGSLETYYDAFAALSGMERAGAAKVAQECGAPPTRIGPGAL